MSRATMRCFLAGIALAAGGFGWLERGRAEGRVTAGDAASAHLARLRKQQADLQESREVGARRLRELEQRLSALHAVRPDKKPSAPRSRPQLMLDLALDPGMQALRQKHYRLMIDLQDARLFRQLGWSAEQIAKFEDLAEDAEGQRLDLNSAAAILDLSRADVAKLNRAKNDELAAIQREWMGPAAYTQMQDFDRTEPERAVASGMNGSLLLTGTPMSEAQSAQVVQTLRASRGPASSTGAPGAIDWDQATQQAASYLSPPQLAALKSAAADARSRELEGQLTKLVTGWEATLPPPGPNLR